MIYFNSFFYHTIVTDELPSHNHTFTGTQVTTSGGTPHTHGRGTMNITGSFRAYSWETGDASGAYTSYVTYWSQIPALTSNGSWSNSKTYTHFNFNAANGWSGSLATESAHTHTVTAAGSIGNTGNN